MRLIKLYDIEIRLNLLLCIGFLFFFFYGYVENVIISFLLVFMHELGHTLAAYFFGYHVEYIEIFPFGGVAKISESIGVDPWQEIIIAAAGPFTSFLLALFGYQASAMLSIQQEWIAFYIIANLVIGFFNLLPIIPLDGGRILRAYLAYFVGFKRATKVSLWMSKILCFGLSILGLYTIKHNPMNIMLPFLAFFVYIAAKREYSMAAFVFMKDITEKKQYLLSKGILKTKHLVAVQDSSVKEVMNQFLPRKYHIVTVMDTRCNIVGTLTENQMLEGMLKFGANVTLDKLLRKA